MYNIFSLYLQNVQPLQTLLFTQTLRPHSLQLNAFVSSFYVQFVCSISSSNYNSLLLRGKHSITYVKKKNAHLKKVGNRQRKDKYFNHNVVTISYYGGVTCKLVDSHLSCIFFFLPCEWRSISQYFFTSSDCYVVWQHKNNTYNNVPYHHILTHNYFQINQYFVKLRKITKKIL